MPNMQFMTPFSGGRDDFRHELKKIFLERSKKRTRKTYPKELAVIGILFAKSSDPYAESHIIPELEYFNLRSGSNIDFFCIGYTKKTHNKRLLIREPTTTINGVKLWFDVERFEAIVSEIEQESKWRYSGMTELLLAHASSSYEGTAIEYGSAISCKLEKMQEDKAFTNVREFMEAIFRYAQDPDMNIQKLSDNFAPALALSALQRMLLRLLPSGLGEEYLRARHFVVSDLSKSAGPTAQ